MDVIGAHYASYDRDMSEDSYRESVRLKKGAIGQVENDEFTEFELAWTLGGMLSSSPIGKSYELYTSLPQIFASIEDVRTIDTYSTKKEQKKHHLTLFGLQVASSEVSLMPLLSLCNFGIANGTIDPVSLETVYNDFVKLFGEQNPATIAISVKLSAELFVIEFVHGN
jgi:hypothetical protein